MLSWKCFHSCSEIDWKMIVVEHKLISMQVNQSKTAFPCQNELAVTIVIAGLTLFTSPLYCRLDMFMTKIRSKHREEWFGQDRTLLTLMSFEASQLQTTKKVWALILILLTFGVIFFGNRGGHIPAQSKPIIYLIYLYLNSMTHWPFLWIPPSRMDEHPKSQDLLKL